LLFVFQQQAEGVVPLCQTFCFINMHLLPYNRAAVSKCLNFSSFLLLACNLASITCAQTSQIPAQQYRTDKNISYRTNSDLTEYAKQRCRLDIYYPAATKGFATVVWFHGGGLTNGNRFIPEALKGKGLPWWRPVIGSAPKSNLPHRSRMPPPPPPGLFATSKVTAVRPTASFSAGIRRAVISR